MLCFKQSVLNRKKTLFFQKNKCFCFFFTCFFQPCNLVLFSISFITRIYNFQYEKWQTLLENRFINILTLINFNSTNIPSQHVLPLHQSIKMFSLSLINRGFSLFSALPSSPTKEKLSSSKVLWVLNHAFANCVFLLFPVKKFKKYTISPATINISSQ